MRALVGLVFVLALVFAACGGDDDGGGAAPEEPPSTLPAPVLSVDGHDLEMRTMAVRDAERKYWLFRPTTLDPADPAPLVVGLHGRLGSAGTASSLGFNDVAESEGIVVVYPTAIDGYWDLPEGDTDVEFVDALVAEVSSVTAIDPNRVYAIGYSLGGEMATLLTCHLPDRITAVATVAMFQHHGPLGCPTPTPARVLAIVGELDRTYSIEEGLTSDMPDDPAGPLADEAREWAATNDCNLDYQERSVGDGVVRREYPCESGAALVIYVHSGGHNWEIAPPGGPETNSVIWEFLQQYAEPLASATE